ncbi:efflux transporter outer membrane subunit [Massilia sp. METH4]|uniref:efflux transporter outer membrane subunit n=1 Tax=Massilia sp. METH4 TaxID=3123041 RepID=UPI0030CA8E48
MKPYLLLLLLAGCAAVGPDHREPPTPAPARLGDWHGGAPELRDTGLPVDSAQSYARFDDPVLAGLLRQAASANHDLKMAALRFAQSRLQRDVVAGRLAPRADARTGVARQRQSESGTATRMVDALAPANRAGLIDVLSSPFDAWQAGFDATWEIDLWGRVRRAVEAADAEVARMAALERGVQLGIAVEVARNYHELLAARRQLRIARADIAAGEDVLQLMRSRGGAGLAPELDVVRQEGLLAEQRGHIPALLEEEAQAANRLALLLGAVPGALPQLPGDGAGDAPPGRAPDLALGLPGEIVAHRPDIQAAAERLHAATASIGIATADLYPRVTLGASFGFESVGAGRLGEWGSRQWSVGPSLVLPLFDNGIRRATVQLRGLEQQEAAVAYQQAVLKAWHEVDDALSAYAAERLRVAQWRLREEAGRTALELATVRYRQGLSDALPLLDAQRALLAARRDRVRGEAALTVRLLAICKATGVLPQA